MSDIMRPIAFSALMDWSLEEYRREGSIFGVSTPYHHKGKTQPIFQEKLETPFGPAAGPHTQLAQNLIASYLAGSRFFELKTVQTLDGEDLPVSKPCITAEDECYNCEWSTELRVPEAFDEYVKGWFAIKLLSKELELGDSEGFVFNMSVGYDLEGIKSPKIDNYIEGMKDASGSAIWAECKAWSLDNLNRFSKVDKAFVESISPKVSASITLSTLHGCPPEEIERIATYLITEKKLNTYIKCNPTLLGYETARSILDGLGYDYLVFDDRHFKGDLHFEDAVPMLERLSALCAEKGLEFGVKLTNTFPVQVAAGELPSEEMYMSGRSLFPLTIAVAQKISHAFEGRLRISYSGGADAYNIQSLLEAGIWPITLATTLLKPGGYRRFHQIAELLKDCEKAPFTGVDVGKIDTLAEECREDSYYRKPIKPLPVRKIPQKVPLVSCFISPCRSGCPLEQDIPAYLRLVGEGKHTEALQVILQRNPLPFITGTICSHRCTDKCSRSFYESHVDIRAAKLTAAQGGYDALFPKLAPTASTGKKAAIVGGGPAGMAAAYFLARAGMAVTLFEKRETLGGIVRYTIPRFRISNEMIDLDVSLLHQMKVDIRCGTEITSREELGDYDAVVLAAGAWVPGQLKLEYGESINVLDFLQRFNADASQLKLGDDIVVIGGGNTAMDAARAARRLPGSPKVRIVYRRNKRYMPADEEELALALEDGVEFCQLLAPVGVRDGQLSCKVMRLGQPDASGRRSPEETGETATVPASAVIAAVGESPDREMFKAWGIEVDERGRAVLDSHLYSKSGKTYVIGDAHLGPATVAEAIADAIAACDQITAIDFAKYELFNVAESSESALSKKGILDVGERESESRRCLECATVCELCVDVCPNRANVAIKVPGLVQEQILHIDGMCNECGNCETFCPYQSAPYRDKFTLYWSEGDFEDSENNGFLLEGEGLRLRLNGKVTSCSLDDPQIPRDLRAIIQTAQENCNYLFAGSR